MSAEAERREMGAYLTCPACGWPRCVVDGIALACPACDREAWKRIARELEGMRDEARAEVERLRAAFAVLLEEAEDMRAYVPDYFAQKWKHDDALGAARAALALSDHQATPDEPGETAMRPGCWDVRVAVLRGHLNAVLAIAQEKDTELWREMQAAIASPGTSESRASEDRP